MRRSFVVIPFILLLMFNACVPNPYEVSPENTLPAPVGTAVGSTQTAAVWTATASPTPTRIPNTLAIVTWLNAEPTKDQFTSRLDQLESTIGASYQFLEVEFLKENDVVTEFRVDVLCECAANGQCCTAERMFVVTMLKMKPYTEDIIREVPETVKVMRVVTYDSMKPIPSLSVDWENVKNFLRENMHGNQFGFQVTRQPAP